MPKNWRRGKSKNNAVTKSNTIEGKLWADYFVLGTWAAVGRKYKISDAMAYRVAGGYEPHKPAIRAALGLPALGLGPVCEVHGRVCAVRHHAPKQASGPKRIYIRKPLNTVWAVNTLEW